MRYDKFAKWLEDWPTPRGAKMGKYTVKFYVDAIGNIETAENIDMDKEFQKDGMAWISNLYSYSVQDNENNHPNPTNLAITKPSPYSTLSNYKTAINHYHRFCKKHSPK